MVEQRRPTLAPGKGNLSGIQRGKVLKPTENLCSSKRLKGRMEKNELKSLYLKLRNIIPSCQNKPVSSVDIVLRAVDYINELHEMLAEEDMEPPPLVPSHHNETPQEDR